MEKSTKYSAFKQYLFSCMRIVILVNVCRLFAGV